MSYLQTMAFATVTVPLSVIERVSGGLYSVPTLLSENTLCALAGLGMSAVGRANLLQRVVTGNGGYYKSPFFPPWVNCDNRPVRTCGKCEWDMWTTYGVRAILCPHQIPFVTACFTCGNLLTKRVEGVRPPKRAFTAAPRSVLRFARVAQRVADEANAVGPFKRKLVELLRDRGYVHPYGTFRTSALRHDFHTFCRSSVSDEQLLKLAQYPWRINELLWWIGDAGHANEERTCTIHPVYIILFEQFLMEEGQCGAKVPHSLKSEALRTWPYDWVARTAGAAYRIPVDRRRRYGRRDLPALVAAGRTREEIRDLIGVAWATTIDEYLRDDGLRPLYDNIRNNLKRREARERWVALERLFPRLSCSALRRKSPNLFAWLESNDKRWWRQRLEKRRGRRNDESTEMLLAKMTNSQCSALEDRVRQAIDRIYESNPPRRCSFVAILGEAGLNPTTLRVARMLPRIDKLILCSHESNAEYQARRKIANSRDSCHGLGGKV